VQLRRAATDEDFRAVHGLVAEMGLWDVAECDRLRIDSSEVLPTYYADDPERLRAKFTAPSCGMFLALRGGEALGCAGHLRDGAAQEVTKLFVRPAARGLGLGRTLLAAVIASARP